MSEPGPGAHDPGSTGYPGPGQASPGASGYPGQAGYSGATGYRGSHDPGPVGIPGLPGPIQQLARNAWQAVLLIGFSAVLLGIMALVWPHATLVVIGALFGVYLLVSGILQIAAAFGTHADTSVRVLAFISGALSIVLGLFCFRGALESILLLAIWIGIAWLFRGISQAAAAASDPLMPARGWQMFSGIVGIIAGVVVLTEPVRSVWVLTLFAGIWLLITGVVEIVTALRIRSHAKQIPQGV